MRDVCTIRWVGSPGGLLLQYRSSRFIRPYRSLRLELLEHASLRFSSYIRCSRSHGSVLEAPGRQDDSWVVKECTAVESSDCEAATSSRRVPFRIPNQNQCSLCPGHQRTRMDAFSSSRDVDARSLCTSTLTSSPSLLPPSPPPSSRQSSPLSSN